MAGTGVYIGTGGQPIRPRMVGVGTPHPATTVAPDYAQQIRHAVISGTTATIPPPYQLVSGLAQAMEQLQQAAPGSAEAARAAQTLSMGVTAGRAAINQGQPTTVSPEMWASMVETVQAAELLAARYREVIARAQMLSQPGASVVQQPTLWTKVRPYVPYIAVGMALIGGAIWYIRQQE